jgi:hypothetical protein
MDTPQCPKKSVSIVPFLLINPYREAVMPSDILEHQKKAFDFAADLTKQLITLSTSIVTISLLFGDHFPKQSKLALWAWVFYLASSLFGLWTLMALTGTLAPIKAPPASFDLGFNVRLPSGLQVLAFAIAITITIRFVFVWYGHR